MNIEQLSKSQLVLLTLLVSFVSSVATGIVTVTLMEQAPPAITQTVNRVVERTIEKVTPTGEVAGAASTVIEKPVIVRESELITKAVAAIEPSIVRLYAPGRDETGRDIKLFVGIAVVANSSGILLADVGTPTSGLTGLRSDGVEVSLKALARVDGAKIISLQAPLTAEVSTGEGKTEMKSIEWTPATFKSDLSQLGETVVVISGREATKIATGIITGSESSDTKKQALETNIPLESYAAGSPLLNADGQIIGMATREMRDAKAGFLASPSILLYSEPTQNENTSANP
jgi:hypothetical protein